MTTHQVSPFDDQERTCACSHFALHEIDDDVDTAAARFTPHGLDEVFAAVVDHDIGAQFATELGLFFAARDGDDSAARTDTELHRR